MNTDTVLIRNIYPEWEYGVCITCWRNPTAYELKFGEGAIHYRDFTESEIGKNKNGDLKKWFKAKDDGLIYHRY